MLKDILYKVNIQSVKGDTSIDIKNLQIDSRKVTPGTCFIALKGYSINGHDFIKDAIENGASAIICEILPEKMVDGITYVSVVNSSIAVGLMSHNFYAAWEEKVCRKA